MLKTIILCFLFLLLNDVFASGGTSSVGGGGDASAIRSLIMKHRKEYLIKGLINTFSERPKNVRTYVKHIIGMYAENLLEVKEPNAKKIFQDMIENGLREDIKKIEFVISRKCLDQSNIERSASTKMNDRGGVICINPYRIVDEFGPYIQSSDIIGLVMHEIAHHYGYEDEDHFFAASMAMNHYEVDEVHRLKGYDLRLIP